MRLGLSALVLTAMLGFGAASAAPSTMGGNAALTVASLVAPYSPSLTPGQKHVMHMFLAGTTSFPSSGAPIHLHVDAIHCQLGDVSIVTHRCQVTYGTHTISDNGEEGAALLANLALAGVFADGAAGTIHYDLTNLNCTIDVAMVKSNAGGGVSCSYTP